MRIGYWDNKGRTSEDEAADLLRRELTQLTYEYRVALGKAEMSHWPDSWHSELFSRCSVRSYDGCVTGNTIEAWVVVYEGNTIGRVGRSLGGASGAGYLAPSSRHTPSFRDLAWFPSKEAAAFAWLRAADRGAVPTEVS